MAANMRIRYERANGKKGLVVAPNDVAWRLARLLAAEFGGAVMVGLYGEARICEDGTGWVVWSQASQCPGEMSRFEANVVVCIGGV